MASARDWEERLRSVLDPEPRPLSGGFQDFRPAAVLVGIGVDPSGEPHLLLTRRTHHVDTHRGQIALPGGAREAGETPVETALREAREEVGLHPAHVRVVGYLPEVFTPVGYRVVPVVGVFSLPYPFHPEPREVDEVFLLPLRIWAHLRPHRVQVVRFRGIQHRVMHFLWEGRDIWGMTARILLAFRRRLPPPYGETPA